MVINMNLTEPRPGYRHYLVLAEGKKRVMLLCIGSMERVSMKRQDFERAPKVRLEMSRTAIERRLRQNANEMLPKVTPDTPADVAKYRRRVKKNLLREAMAALDAG